jgi:hypothetical protein
MEIGLGRDGMFTLCADHLRGDCGYNFLDIVEGSGWCGASGAIWIRGPWVDRGGHGDTFLFPLQAAEAVEMEESLLCGEFFGYGVMGRSNVMGYCPSSVWSTLGRRLTNFTAE